MTPPKLLKSTAQQRPSAARTRTENWRQSIHRVLSRTAHKKTLAHRHTHHALKEGNTCHVTISVATRKKQAPSEGAPAGLKRPLFHVKNADKTHTHTITQKQKQKRTPSRGEEKQGQNLTFKRNEQQPQKRRRSDPTATAAAAITTDPPPLADPPAGLSKRRSLLVPPPPAPRPAPPPAAVLAPPEQGHERPARLHYPPPGRAPDSAARSPPALTPDGGPRGRVRQDAAAHQQPEARAEPQPVGYGEAEHHEVEACRCQESRSHRPVAYFVF